MTTLENYDNSEKKGNAPVNQLTVRGCHVAVWEHTNSEGKEYKQITTNKIYKDSEGNLKNGNSFSVNDIPNLVIALEEIYKKEVLKN